MQPEFCDKLAIDWVMNQELALESSFFVHVTMKCASSCLYFTDKVV